MRSGLFRVTEINGIDQLFDLRAVWNKVLDRSKNKNVFLTWEYLSTYWKHFGKDKKLRVLCIEDNGNVAAIAPLRQTRYRLLGPLGYSVVEPLGCRGLMPEGADYTGFLLGEREAECLRLFLNHLVDHDDWDFIHLIDFPETSIDLGLFARASKAIPLAFELEKGAMCPYIPLPDSVDVFLKELSSKFRKDLRRCMRNLERDYHKVELRRYDEFGSVEESMMIFFKLHQKRWKLRHRPGVFNTREVRGFYIDVAKLFASNGWLSLYFLTANDEPIAAQYSFEYGRKMYYALGGFDPDYSRYSVGNLTLMKIMEKCIERKIGEYDLLKGGEQYKFDWTARYRRNLVMKFVNRRFASNLYHWGLGTIKQLKMKEVLQNFLK